MEVYNILVNIDDNYYRVRWCKNCDDVLTNNEFCCAECEEEYREEHPEEKKHEDQCERADDAWKQRD